MTPDAVLVLEIGNEREHFEAAFPELDVVWLPTELHDDAVLLDIRADLDPAGYAAFAQIWQDAGATIIGGCCGIGPEHIAALRKPAH